MPHATELAIEQVKRTANSQTVLSYIAAAFLLMFGAFWYAVWSQFLAPPGLISPQAIITLVLTLCYTVVWPLFGSMLIPNSPARHFLQKQTWALPGSIAVMGITLFLAWFALRVFMAWMAAQPGIEQNPDLYWPAVIGVFVGAFFVPTLCWATATPEQLIAQIQQALWVEEMERAAKLRRRVWHATDLRAQALIHAGQVHGMLTLAQSRELSGIMLASHRTLQRGLLMVARTMDESARIEDLIPSTSDTELAELYRRLPRLLAAADEAIGDTVETIELEAAASERPPRYVTGSSIALPTAETDASADASAPSVAVHHGPQRTVDGREVPYAEQLRIVWQNMAGAFKRTDVERLTCCEKSKASAMIAHWKETGQVQELDRTSHTYTYTEEARRWLR